MIGRIKHVEHKTPQDFLNDLSLYDVDINLTKFVKVWTNFQISNHFYSLVDILFFSYLFLFQSVLA